MPDHVAPSSAQPNRRSFLGRSSLVAASALAIPYFVPSRCFGANDRIVTGHIGVGGQGGGNLGAFLKLADVAAVCDVDSKRAAAAGKRVEGAGGKCEVFEDYRKLLERKDIDAVVISSPDHWHAQMTVDACRAGKDVYVEKPLSLTIAEGRAMVQVARENGRMVQTGSQQRSAKEFRLAAELVRNGYIGKLQKVLVGIPGPNHPGKPIADSDPPAELNYDLWLGPAQFRPYNKNRVHYNFRFFKDYSGGQMTNWGAHHIDIAHWGMGADDRGPVSVEGTAEFHPEKWHEVTEKCRIVHTYADDVVMTVGQGQKDIPQGTTFIGDKGTIFVNRGKITADPPELLKIAFRESDTRLIVSKGHHQNFVDSVKTRVLPICDVEIGHRSATACHLSNIAAQLQRKLQWDPVKEQFIGDDEANGLLSRTYRSPWKLA